MMADTESFCPGGAEAAIGQGRAARHSQRQEMPAWPALSCLTQPLAFSSHYAGGLFSFFLSDFIFGPDTAADLQVAAGIWKHHLPSLFHWTQLSAAGQLTRMSFKSLSVT